MSVAQKMGTSFHSKTENVSGREWVGLQLMNLTFSMREFVCMYLSGLFLDYFNQIFPVVMRNDIT